MAQIKLLPPLAHLQVCFIYKPETGVLIWRERPREHFADLRSWSRCKTQFAGKPAGNINKAGYLVVLLNRVPYLSHRIAWKLMTGDEPPASIDHINGNRLDNRWDNLRAATVLQQIGNQRIHRTNKSGYRGVYLHRDGKWVAQLGRRYLECFYSFKQAASVYESAAREHFGEFYRQVDS